MDEESNAQSLALRFSSRTINQDLGFIFGRNTNLSDIIIAPNSARHVSNTHFRIYLGDNGVLMLEDISTNGTLVDHVNLRGKLGMSLSTRILCSGSTIEIFRSKQDEHVKFSVHLPSHKEHEEEYRRNYNAYLGRSGFAIRDYAAKSSIIGSNGKQFRGVIDAGPSSKKALLRSVSNPHGMHWNGGWRYNVVGLLKKGAFATVYMLATIKGGQLLVAKELDKKRLMKNRQTDHRLDNKMRIMRTLQHPNIIQNIDYQDIGSHIYIITEYIHYGDLQDYLSSYGPLPKKLARSIAKQVLNALVYLHQKKIIHRNIKPESILIASVEPFVVKLTNFGLSIIVKNNDTFLKTFCGTLLYCAPEVFPYYRAPLLNFHSCSQLVDIWSFAAVLWYALCCEPPFEGVADYNEQGMFEKVMGTQLDPTRLKEQGVSEEACGLLIAMLNVDPAQRLTEQQCLEHPWLVDDEMILDFNNEDESEDAGDETEDAGGESEDASGETEDASEETEDVGDESEEPRLNLKTTVSQDPMQIASLCGWQIGRDRFPETIEGNETVLITSKRGVLGHGRVGVVEKVRCQQPGFLYLVRKRINISCGSTYQTTRAIEAINREIRTLRNLGHLHIIKIIGSYQEKIASRHFYFLLMFPVGNNDLEGFLMAAAEVIRQGTPPKALQYSRWLRKWFGCLASALAYMHSQGVHHEDIKPRNIVHRREEIYFTDFSSAREVDLASQVTSTESPALATRIYAASDVFPDEHGNNSRHGSKSDVFSLGTVFIEMLTVLDGKNIGSLREGLPAKSPYHKITHTFDDWFASKVSTHMYTKCVKPMLAPERQDRPTATEVVDCIRGSQPWRAHACPCQNMTSFSS